jgi:CheY-like chemotaxis protein
MEQIKPLSILVIDDDPSIGMLFTNMLEFSNAKVVFCDHPQKGWKAIDKEEFQLIITDLKMPVISGDEFIKIIRSSRLNHLTPIILCSGDLDKFVMAELINESKVYFLPKPFEHKTLLDLISKALFPKVNIHKSSQPLHEKWLASFSQKLKQIGIGKTEAVKFENFALWNFESISATFNIREDLAELGVSLLLKPKTFLDLAGKIQDTHYKKMEPETLLIWQDLLKTIYQDTGRVTFSRLVGQDFLSVPGQELQFYILTTDIGEILVYLN